MAGGSSAFPQEEQRGAASPAPGSPAPSRCPSPSLPGQMEGSSFLIIKISASWKTRSMLLALQIIAFGREEQ